MFRHNRLFILLLPHTVVTTFSASPNASCHFLILSLSYYQHPTVGNLLIVASPQRRRRPCRDAQLGCTARDQGQLGLTRGARVVRLRSRRSGPAAGGLRNAGSILRRVGGQATDDNLAKPPLSRPANNCPGRLGRVHSARCGVIGGSPEDKQSATEKPNGGHDDEAGGSSRRNVLPSSVFSR